MIITRKRRLAFLLSFLMVATMIPILPVAAATSSFKDVQDTDWFYNSVQYVNDNSLFYGTSEDTFEPQTTMTRAMIVTVLHRMEKQPAAEPAAFKDVPSDKWFTDSVAWAAADGVVNGYDADTFGPNDAVTREQIATILFRYAEKKGYDVSKRADLREYTDNEDISGWAVDALEWANDGGLIVGFEDATIAPGANATRAQVATILMRFCEEYVKAEEKNYTVTFDYNDGSDNVYETLNVQEGSSFNPPISPEREGFAFQGWYEDEDCNSVYDFSQSVKGDLNLYAAWEEKAEMESAGGELHSDTYAVLDFAIDGDEGIVEISTIDSCLLKIDFLDEDTESLIDETAMMVAPDLQVEQVRIPLNVNLPEHFLVVLHLLSTEGDELCPRLTCMWYTTQYELFEEQTIYDFPDQVVVNFDDDEQDNFGVLVDGAQEFYTESVTEENNTYTITDADEELKELQSGDIAVLHTEDDDAPILLKVDEIELDGDDVIISADPSDTNLSDYYDVLKLDMTLDAGEGIVDTSDAYVEDLETGETEEIQTYGSVNQGAYEDPSLMGIDLGGIDESWEKTQNVEFSLPFFKLDLSKTGKDGQSKENASLNVTGSISNKVKISVTCKYDVILFGRDYLYYKTECENKDGELKLNLEAEWAPLKEFNKDNLVFTDPDKKLLKTKNLEEVTGKKELHLGKLTIPTNVPCLTVQFEFSAPVDLKLSGSLSITQTFSSKSGTVYSTTDGTQKISEKNSELKFSLQGKAGLKVGPKFKLSVNLLDEVVEAGISAWAGLEISAEAHIDLVDASIDKSAESLHRCFLCIDGDVDLFFDVNVSVDVKITEHILNGNIVSWDIVGLKAPLFTFSWSLLNSPDSVYQGKPHFEKKIAGKASCLNNVYRTHFLVENDSGEEVPDAVLTVTNAEGNNVTDDTNGAIHYYYPGTYKVSADVDGKNISRSFTVDSSAQDVVLSAKTSDGKLSGKVINADDNSPVKEAKVEVYSGGLLIDTKETGMDGQFSFDLGMGNYLLKIAAKGYVTFSSYETVISGENTIAQTSLLVAGNDYEFGGMSGRITDALTGQGIEGVTIELYKNWNSRSYSDYVSVHETTDSDGYFTFDINKLFNVPIGTLKAGYYTVIATKDGYEKTYYNAVVMPGQVKGDQNGSMMPHFDGKGEYSIVLTWGNEPSDLDSHLNAINQDGSRVHIYYSSQSWNEGNLDVDDTSSYGPETVTVHKLSDLRNGFTYSVHDYSNSGSSDNRALSDSGAKVVLYHNNTEVRTFNVPANQIGTVWNVFSIDSSGNLSVLNTFENISNADSVGQAYIN